MVLSRGGRPLYLEPNMLDCVYCVFLKRSESLWEARCALHICDSVSIPPESRSSSSTISSM